MPFCKSCDDTGYTDGTPDRNRNSKCTDCYCEACTFAPCQCEVGGLVRKAVEAERERIAKMVELYRDAEVLPELGYLGRLADKIRAGT